MGKSALLSFLAGVWMGPAQECVVERGLRNRGKRDAQGAMSQVKSLWICPSFPGLHTPHEAYHDAVFTTSKSTGCLLHNSLGNSVQCGVYVEKPQTKNPCALAHQDPVHKMRAASFTSSSAPSLDTLAGFFIVSFPSVLGLQAKREAHALLFCHPSPHPQTKQCRPLPLLLLLLRLSHPPMAFPPHHFHARIKPLAPSTPQHKEDTPPPAHAPQPHPPTHPPTPHPPTHSKPYSLLVRHSPNEPPHLTTTWVWGGGGSKHHLLLPLPCPVQTLAVLRLLLLPLLPGWTTAALQCPPLTCPRPCGGGWWRRRRRRWWWQ